MAYRPGEPAEYHVPSRAEPAGPEFGLCTERARHARRLSIKVNALAAGHGKFANGLRWTSGAWLKPLAASRGACPACAPAPVGGPNHADA